MATTDPADPTELAEIVDDIREYATAVHLMFETLVDHLVARGVIDRKAIIADLEALYADQVGNDRLGQFAAAAMEGTLDRLVDGATPPKPPFRVLPGAAGDKA